MSIVNSPSLKKNDPKDEPLKVAYLAAETLLEKVGPSLNTLKGVDERDIKYLAPNSYDREGTFVPRSWYTDPATQLGKPLTITYSFATTSLLADSSKERTKSFIEDHTIASKRNVKEFSAMQKELLKGILSNIADMTNITFKEVKGSNTDLNNASLLFLNGNLGSVNGVAGLPFSGSDSTQESHEGMIMFDNTKPDGSLRINADYEKGTSIFTTMIHEVAHALGLKHPHANTSLETSLIQADKTGSLNKDSFILANDNPKLSGSNTVMSYKGLVDDAFMQNGTYNQRYATSYKHLDVLALQYIYGNGSEKSSSTAGGKGHTKIPLENLWNNGRNSGGMQDVLTDAGGNDTLIGHSTRPNNIDLTSGASSDIGYGHSLWLGAANAASFLFESRLNDKIPADADAMARLYKGEGNLVLAANSVFENATGGSKGDVLKGNEYNNNLLGLAGDDKLYGGGGRDKLWGGEGNDLLDGGDGNDDLNGDDGNQDIASYASSSASVFVSLLEETTKSSAGNDRITAIENVIGSDYDDIIYGDSFKNILVGGKGSDALYGDDGDDILHGSASTIGYDYYTITDTSLNAQTGSSPSGFGDDIATEGRVMVIAAPIAKKIFVYYETNKGVWDLKQTLSRSDVSGFGSEVELKNGVLVVGSNRSVKSNSTDIHEMSFYGWNSDTKKFGAPADISGIGTTGVRNITVTIDPSDTSTTDPTIRIFFNEVVPGRNTFFYYLDREFTNLSDANGGLGTDKSTPKKFKDIGEFSSHAGYALTMDVVFDTVKKTNKPLRGIVHYSAWDANLSNESTVSESAIKPGTAFAGVDNILAVSTTQTKTPTSQTSGLWDTISGIVQILRKNSTGDWVQEAMLMEESITANDKYGASLALTKYDSGYLLAVGAPSSDKGKVYIYKLVEGEDWVLQNIVSSPSASDFGKQVAFSSLGTLIVTATDGVLYSFEGREFFPQHTVASDANPSSNKLYGGSGNDTLIRSKNGGDILDGGSGTDTAIFNDYSSKYVIKKYTTDFLTVTRGSDVDLLYNIEYIKFYNETLQTADIKITTDNKAPTPTIVSTVSDANSITITVSSDEAGFVHALLYTNVAPAEETLRSQGQSIKVAASTAVTFTFNDLEPDTTYKVGLLADDEGGKSKAISSGDIKTSTNDFLDFPPVEATDNGFILEVNFALKAPGKVYYAYYTTAPPTAPSILAIKGTPAGAEEYGTVLVTTGKQEQIINIFGTTNHDFQKVYLYLDGSNAVRTTTITQLSIDHPLLPAIDDDLDDMDVLGLSYTDTSSEWI